MFDVREAVKEGAPIIHDEPDADGIHDRKHNIAAHYDVEIGNIANGLKEADFVVEEEFETQYAQHCPLEPHVCIGYLDENHRIVLRTATQVPWHARPDRGAMPANSHQSDPRHQTAHRGRIRRETGDHSRRFVRADHAADASAREDRVHAPRRIHLQSHARSVDRQDGHRREEGRHVHGHRPAGDELDGRVWDAFADAADERRQQDAAILSLQERAVLGRLGVHKPPGHRRVSRLRRDAGRVRHRAGDGHHRGQLGIDPIELRKKNHIQKGETNPVFAALGEGKEGHDNPIESCGLDECIDRAAAAIGWNQKHRLYQKRDPNAKVKRGIGLACLMQGSGIAGIDMASARIKMNEDGSFNLLMGATDLGTGSDTVLAQIAAQVLGISTDKILTYSSDTDMTPFDKGAYASSTTYVSGGAVKKAAEASREKILKVAAEMLKDDVANLRCENAKVISKSGKEVPYPNIIQRSLYGQNQFQINGEASHISYVSPPPFAAHFAEVEVDTETGQVRVVDYVAAVDCGVAINPKLAEGQMEGAAMNGLSYALCEQMVFDERDRMLNPSFFDYRLFTTVDAPKIRTILVETYEPTGPFGAKSIAEIGINGPLPVANAIYDACGVRMKKAPFTGARIGGDSGQEIALLVERMMLLLRPSF